MAAPIFDATDSLADAQVWPTTIFPYDAKLAAQAAKQLEGDNPGGANPTMQPNGLQAPQDTPAPPTNNETPNE